MVGLSSLFGDGAQGFTFEPWDITTLYQDRAGTTPVTAAGQSVGLRLDKSRGAAVGSELVTNGDFSSGTTGWVATSSTLAAVSGELEVTATSTSQPSATRAITTVAEKWYRATVTFRAAAGNSVARSARFRIGTNSGGGSILAGPYEVTANGVSRTVSVMFKATTATTYPLLEVGNTGAYGAIGDKAYFDNVSIKEVAGNHEVAINDAARGIYGWTPKTGRRNLLNATDTLATQSVTVTAAAHTLAFTGTGTVTLSGTSTAGPLVGTGAGNRVTLTFTPTAGSLTLTVTGSVTMAQLQLGSVDTAYQRVASAYDITEAGVASCYYVQPDGVDDAYVTPTITPGTDKAQVFMALKKLGTGATAQIIAEMSVTRAANNGAFTVGVPGSVAGLGAFLVSRGTVDATAQVTTGYTPPTHVVLSGLTDISGDVATLRANGSQIAQAVTDQGTGNFLAYPAYLYARGGTTQPFNGRDYGHVVRFGPNLDAAAIERTESLLSRNLPTVTL